MEFQDTNLPKLGLRPRGPLTSFGFRDRYPCEPRPSFGFRDRHPRESHPSFGFLDLYPREPRTSFGFRDRYPREYRTGSRLRHRHPCESDHGRTTNHALIRQATGQKHGDDRIAPLRTDSLGSKTGDVRGYEECIHYYPKRNYDSGQVVECCARQFKAARICTSKYE